MYMKELWANIEKKNQTNIINLLLHLTNASNGCLAFNDSKVSSYCHQDAFNLDMMSVRLLQISLENCSHLKKSVRPS